jgi:hypothetical protein
MTDRPLLDEFEEWHPLAWLDLVQDFFWREDMKHRQSFMLAEGQHHILDSFDEVEDYFERRAT